MRWTARIRMLLARRPLLYWMAVTTVALVIGMSLRSAAAQAERQRDSWGSVSAVLVAEHRLGPGERLAGAVSVRNLPNALLAASALHALPAGATARQYIAEGEVLVALDVTPDSGPLSLLPRDWLAIAIEEPNSTAFGIGDSAAVLAGGRIIAPIAVVLQVAVDGIVIGVPTDVAGAVAEAANQHVVTVALSANPPPR